jgi:hypothetical protein
MLFVAAARNARVCETQLSDMGMVRIDGIGGVYGIVAMWNLYCVWRIVCLYYVFVLCVCTILLCYRTFAFVLSRLPPMLAFTSVYFSESGLFNGLRPIQIKNSFLALTSVRNAPDAWLSPARIAAGLFASAKRLA